MAVYRHVETPISDLDSGGKRKKRKNFRSPTTPLTFGFLFSPPTIYSCCPPLHRAKSAKFGSDIFLPTLDSSSLHRGFHRPTTSFAAAVSVRPTTAGASALEDCTTAPSGRLSCASSLPPRAPPIVPPPPRQIPFAQA